MFDRLLKVISEDDLNKIKKVNVLILGIGGVGGYALETLARIGVENFIIIDNDLVEESNLNRQIISLHSNIGKYKVDVAESRILDINPNINVIKIRDFITKYNIDNIFNYHIEYIVDACDTVTTKVLLIKKVKEKDITLISCMGTGNRIDPTKVKILDIYMTKNDPLAKIMRKLLKDEHIKKQDVIYSEELPIKNGSRTPGSTSLVPSTAGIYAAYYIIKKILKLN